MWHSQINKTECFLKDVVELLCFLHPPERFPEGWWSLLAHTHTVVQARFLPPCVQGVQSMKPSTCLNSVSSQFWNNLNKTIIDAVPTSSNLITLKCVLSFLIQILVIGIPGVVEFDNTLALGNTHTHTHTHEFLHGVCFNWSRADLQFCVSFTVS